MSSIFIEGSLQHGQIAPDCDSVAPASSLSCFRFWAALPFSTGTFVCTPNITPSRFSFTSIVSSTRLFSFLHSHFVFSNGIVARQFLHFTVRAHRYATVGLPSTTG